ncbi:MAG: GDCCVxC domain-containing (seleno)protein [Gammaproteobacteria bacterium]|jgi:hypothetical protein
MKAIVTESELTCPECGYSEVLTMPADACLWFHECNRCHRLLKPRPGDCCVFCSFGSVPCPPEQTASAGDDPDRAS